MYHNNANAMVVYDEPALGGMYYDQGAYQGAYIQPAQQLAVVEPAPMVVSAPAPVVYEQPAPVAPPPPPVTAQPVILNEQERMAEMKRLAQRNPVSDAFAYLQYQKDTENMERRRKKMAKMQRKQPRGYPPRGPPMAPPMQQQPMQQAPVYNYAY